MNDSLCHFRMNHRHDGVQELADCGFLQRVTGLNNAGQCTVTKSTCEICVKHLPVKSFLQNPVLLSKLYSVCDAALETSEHQATSQLQELRNWAEQVIVAQSEVNENDVSTSETSAPPESKSPHLPAEHIAFGLTCDVVLWLDFSRTSPEQTQQAIESILNQTHVQPRLHLCSAGVEEAAFAAQHQGWRVEVHEMPARLHPLEAVHRILPRLQSPFVAVQYSHAISHHHRLAASLIRLIDDGADVMVAPVETPQGLLFAQTFTDHCTSSLPVETLVFRKASFVDLGGCGQDCETPALEFLARALTGGYRLTLGLEALAKMDRSDSLESAPLANPRTSKAPAELRQQAIGFEYQPVACDVVLPFHGHLDYTSAALESVLQQKNAQTVVHLVDDATPGPEVIEFLNEWSEHPQVRTYRNLHNLGQFSSFNNVSPYFETEFVAVQDADDISLPHRCYEAINLLRLTGADYYGGAVECFGDEYVLTSTRNIHGAKKRKRQTHRYSSYPLDRRIDYFVENPTAVFRVSLFREMGGYADFGNNLVNRASLDTEFLCRCRFSLVSFAISRSIVTKYRVHADSATQNTSTGWGTGPRAEAARNVQLLFEKYRKNKFHPRQFGALGRYASATIKYQPD